MQVTVKLFASFRVGRFNQAQQEFAAGTRVEEVAAGLGILAKDIGIIMVNGRHATLDHELQPGATLSLFPLLGGG